MAKLTPGQYQGTPGSQIPNLRPPVATAQPTQGAVPAVTPTPFAVVAPTSARVKKTSTRKQPTAKTPSLKGEPWFRENFSGQASDVVQIRKYPSRKDGFHCPPCGIAGSNGIVIKGKDGRGEEIAIYEIDPSTRELRQTGTIRGFIVGETCLKKYGGVDIRKLSASAPAAKAQQPVETPESQQPTEAEVAAQEAMGIPETQA